MSVFANAAYAVEGPTSLLHTLPGWLQSPRAPRPRGPRQGAYRTAHDPRGFRYVGGTAGPALWLLQAYRAIGASGTELLAFRNGLVAWSILSDSHSLHEVLRASHRLGMGDEAERTVVDRDGVRLHRWAQRAFSLGVPLPHHQMYNSRARFVSAYGVSVPEDIRKALDAAMAGRRMDTEDNRVEVAEEWLERFGEAGREAVRALAPGT
ncbi:hypothetical protein SAZ11_15420 [Streptomyces sp. FXJ1.4098]|nr:hypothetical protein [Streptomyces sp. FXJ1.4098]